MKNNQPAVRNAPRNFTSRKAHPTCSYASATSNGTEIKAQSARSSITVTDTSDNKAHPQFLEYLIILENRYEPELILKAFQLALPKLKATQDELDKTYIMYETLLRLKTGRSISENFVHSRTKP